MPRKILSQSQSMALRWTRGQSEQIEKAISQAQAGVDDLERRMIELERQREKIERDYLAELEVELDLEPGELPREIVGIQVERDEELEREAIVFDDPRPRAPAVERAVPEHEPEHAEDLEAVESA